MPNCRDYTQFLGRSHFNTLKISNDVQPDPLANVSGMFAMNEYLAYIKCQDWAGEGGI